MKRKVLAVAAAVGVLTLSTTAFAGGKEIFISEKCTKCHEIKSQKIESTKKEDAVDLSGIGGKHDATWFKGWLTKTIEKDSTLKPGTQVKHKKMWEGSDADLGALVDFLLTLK